MRNQVWGRLSHAGYTKGSALSAIRRRLCLDVDSVLAAGDDLNDLSMLARRHAGRLVAPANAVPRVKEAVRERRGFVSALPSGEGVAEGIAWWMNRQVD